jgi:signal transduction histidine kinase
VEDAQRELLALQRVSVAAQSTLRLDEVLGQIAQGVADGLSFELAIVYLADPDNRTISMPVRSTADAARTADGEPMALDASNPTTRALLANKVLITHDIDESLLPRLFASGFLHRDEVPPDSTIANLPLASKGQVIGGMALTTRRPALAATEIDSLRSFASQAAATIANARLYQELERAYRDVRTAQDQLIQAERLRTLGQVASGVAHDFNNILAAILSRTQLAQQQTRSAPLRDTLKIIEQAALDGAGAARRIQSLARPREERMPETVDLSAVTQQALDLTQPMWANAARVQGIELAAETSLIPDALVEGHASELREVLTNLILNATAAMPAGGRLTLRTERRVNEVWCSVEDTGTGMSEDVKGRIFDPFFTTKGSSGSGLGMSIVAAILERHRARIEIDTVPGRGTAIRFGLPARDGAVGTSSPRKKRGRVSLRILLAGEDEPANEALSSLLARRGHRVWSAVGAEDSIKLMVEQEYDIIITDLGLGEHSGWEVAEAAKVVRPGAGVVLATAWAADWNQEEIRRRGVDAILSKPYTVDEVLVCLEQALVKSV